MSKRGRAGQLVCVTWEDSVQPWPSWILLEDYQPEPAVAIRSVGWIVHSTKRVLALAPNLGGGASNKQVSGTIHIPQSCILKVERLSVGRVLRKRGEG